MEQHLDFEQPIYTCLEKIEELKKIVPAPANLADEIALLERQSQGETEKIYAILVLGKRFWLQDIQTDHIHWIMLPMFLMGLKKCMVIV